eukprot:s6344_g2.t1
MASQTLCVWAAPVKRQMPLHAQPGTSTYVWAWPSAPIVVRPLRIIARPVAPAQLQLPHLLGRRSWAMSPEPPKNPKTKAPPKGELRMICVPAQLQLPHLLGRRSWAMSPEPPKNPKTKAPPKWELPMICVAATPVRRPSKTTIPETGVAAPPAQQAPLPPPELEHTKGAPVSFCPETPGLTQGGEEAHEQKKEDEEEANDEPQNPSPRPAEAAKAEPPHAQFGEAELEAFLADLAALGIKVPEKPKGEAEVGDLIVLGANIHPKGFRLRYAVVMQAGCGCNSEA